MRQRIAVLVMTVLVATSGIAAVAGVAAAQTDDSEMSGEAMVSFAAQTVGGSTVTVDSVTLPDGGFVTIHDSTLTDGDTLGSVVGTSAYLESGTHEDVEVSLTDIVESSTFHAMAHQDTDGDRAYTFVSSNGEADGPYTTDGDIVMQAADVTVAATISATDQPTDGASVIVDRVELSDGGFVTVHDSSLGDGEVIGSIRGTSDYLAPGVHENVRVSLDDPLEDDETVFSMAHTDSNDNETYDFPATEGEADGPYTDANGDIVMAQHALTLEDEAMVSFSAQPSGGNMVMVEEVYLPEGGFVTVHDSSLGDGEVIGSIRGTSDYLAPGVHRNVMVELDDPLGEDDSLFAMAHQDTNDNEVYDFPASEGEDDGPYTDADGNIVMQDAPVTVSAAVSFDHQTSDGMTVTVENVDLSEGGFVTMHDASLLGGAVLDSVVGVSDYLEAGNHESVEITLDQPLSETQTLIAMPHVDSDGDEAYGFVDTEDGADGPFLNGEGAAVTAAATVQVTAAVDFQSQDSDGETLTVEQVTLHDGGFVTIHDSTLTDGAVLDSIRGTSAYLAPGTHESVEISLDEPLEDDDTVLAMAHRDTDGDESYGFLDTDGGTDGPYTAAGMPVMTPGEIDIASDQGGETDTSGEEMVDDGAADDGSTADDSTSGDSTGDETPGFGAVVAAVALLATALVAARRE